MNLWIRSQNKGTLMKVEILGHTDGVIKAYFSSGNCELGTYKSSDRALEVLDEIQKIIKWCQTDMRNVTFGDMKNLKGCFDDYVYEMPEE